MNVTFETFAARANRKSRIDRNRRCKTRRMITRVYVLETTDTNAWWPVVRVFRWNRNRVVAALRNKINKRRFDSRRTFCRPESSFDLFVYPNDRRNKRFGTISRWYITVWYPVVFRRFTTTHEYYFNYTLLQRCAITKADVSIYIKLIKTGSDFFSRIVFISEKYNGTRYYCIRKHMLSGYCWFFLLSLW